MDLFTQMSALQAAGLYTALLILLLLGLKLFVGAKRGKLKVVPGDQSDPEFARALRVQHNAVEDVPALLVALVLSALLAAPVWLIHTAGAILLFSRVGHAVGLAGSSGFSLGRALGTLGTLLVYLTLVVTLLQRAFDAGL